MTLLLDLILALTGLEALAFLALRRRHLLPNLAAGAALLLATRAALAGLHMLLLAALLVAGLAHLADLRARWTTRSG